MSPLLSPPAGAFTGCMADKFVCILSIGEFAGKFNGEEGGKGSKMNILRVGRLRFALGPGRGDNSGMKSLRMMALVLVAVGGVPALHALEKQPASVYHARRVALAAKLHGGVAVLFAAEEPLLDLMPYRQDEDFYYLTGWTEPGAALMVVADAPQAAEPRTYKEILFLPTRDLRMEKYTGVKLDAASPGVAQATGVDAVEQMTELPAVLNGLIDNGPAADA